MTPTNATLKLRAALQRILQKLEPELTARDAAGLSGDTRRKLAAQKRIQAYLDRLDEDGARKLFGAPLNDLQNAGRAQFGGAAQALNDEAVAALGQVITDPFKAALATAKTPLPYVKPWMLNEEQSAQAAEIVLEGQARGYGWKKLGQLLQAEFPQLGRPTQTDFIRGTVIEKQGVRVSVERYADMLARTTSVWANNQGALSRCDELGVETVIVPVSPGTIDFCLEFEGKVFALTDAAAEEWGVPLLSSTPNGGPPWHPNCRHSVAPYTPRQRDRGNLPRPGEKLLTRAEGVSRSSQVSGAQAAFKAKLESDPLRYAAQIAESAARRGFGANLSKVPDALIGENIPFLPPGQKEKFAAGKAVSEDVHLVKHGAGLTRVQYRQTISDTLRSASESGEFFADDDGTLKYYDRANHWTAVVLPATGQVLTAHKLSEKRWDKQKAGDE